MSEEANPSWDELREEAALWLARMDSGSVTLAQFEAWRDQDTRHAAAFVQVAATFSTLDRVKAEAKPYYPTPKRSVTRRNLIAATAAALAVAGTGLAAFAVSQARATEITSVGERKTVRLPKGGVLELNTDSQVQWRDDGRVTEIWLQRGEISVDFAGTDRPCRLHTAGREARVWNGRINARLRGTLVDLSVVSGNCLLGGTPPSAGATTQRNPIAIPPAHAVVASATETVVRPLADADVQALSAWPDGELVFRGQSLETAVSEYNRYLKRKIVIVDPSLNPIRLGGRFITQDPSAFLEALRAGFGVRVIDDGSSEIALTKS